MKISKNFKNSPNYRKRKNRKPIERLPQFTTMDAIEG